MLKISEGKPSRPDHHRDAPWTTRPQGPSCARTPGPPGTSPEVWLLLATAGRGSLPSEGQAGVRKMSNARDAKRNMPRGSHPAVKSGCERGGSGCTPKVQPLPRALSKADAQPLLCPGLRQPECGNSPLLHCANLGWQSDLSDHKVFTCKTYTNLNLHS